MAIPKISIRPMRLGDADDVRRLDCLILGDDRSVTWDQRVTRFIEVSDYGALSHPSLGCFVAHRNNVLAGFLLAEGRRVNTVCRAACGSWPSVYTQTNGGTALGACWWSNFKRNVPNAGLVISMQCSDQRTLAT